MSPARWIVLTVRVPSDELTEQLAEGLVALGGPAVVQDDDILTTYIPERPDPDAFLKYATDRLEAVAGTSLELVWRWQADEDWAARWKEGLSPRRVGSRFVVTQPWNPVEPGDGDVVIVIDPSSAFGTGEHATTRGALRLLESAVTGSERVLDVGTGSAILAIAAVALGARSVLAVEADEGAMATAADNVARAGVQDAVELVNAVVDEAYLEAVRGDGFDLIVANVLSGVLTPLLPGFRTALREGGRVIVGGIMLEESAGLRTAGAEAGLVLEAEDVEGEWWTGLMAHP